MPDTADLSRVTALAHKGDELGMKGHDARAAEKFRLAAEEAEQALSDPDSLVTCALRQSQLAALMSHVTTPAERPADADDAMREVCLRLMPSAMAVLERRKAAGTLLQGSCRPVEEAYQIHVTRHILELQGDTQAMEMTPVVYAPYVGVETYFRVASSVAFMLINTGVFVRTFLLSDEQKNTAYLFIASALDLMARPRDYNSWLSGEPGLVGNLRVLIPRVSDLDNPATKQLCAVWRRVLRSGVLGARSIDEGIDITAQKQQHLRSAADADLAAGRLQQCALVGCAARESHASHFKRCGSCRTVAYCCREHQVADWPAHKAACKAARKAAAEDADAA